MPGNLPDLKLAGLLGKVVVCLLVSAAKSSQQPQLLRQRYLGVALVTTKSFSSFSVIFGQSKVPYLCFLHYYYSSISSPLWHLGAIRPYFTRFWKENREWKE